MSIEHPATLVRLQDSLDSDGGNVAIRVPTSGVLYSAPIVAAPVTPGDWSSYTDDFPGSSFGSLWDGGYGTRTVTGNRVRMPTVGYQGQDSVAHDLVDQQIVWKNEPDSTGGYCGATIRRAGGGTVVCTMYSKGGHGTLETEFSNGGSSSTSSITYSSTDHLWMRFRHSSTTNQIFMETSPNGTTWTTRATHSISLADVRTVDIQIEAGEFGGSGSGYAYISKLNLPPAGAAIALDGTSSGSSSSSGNLSLANALAGSSNGTSSSTGSLGLATALTATSTGGSTSSGSLRLAMALTGTSAGTSTSSATQLVNLVPLTGNSAGSSTSTAALALAAALTGTSAGTSTSSASLDLGQGLTGSSSGTSTTTGSLVLGAGVGGHQLGHRHLRRGLDGRPHHRTGRHQ